jgi:hypothetical protein
MSLAPLSLIDAHPWQRVAFTTYAVSLSFFEAVVLDRLVRGGGSQALILADVHGVRAALSEQGAQRVGKDYELEPVAATHGLIGRIQQTLAAQSTAQIAQAVSAGIAFCLAEEQGLDATGEQSDRLPLFRARN